MKIALITDAWRPQINGVVTTLVELVDQLNAQGHMVEVFHPGLFQTRPCPGYAGIDLAVRPFAQLQKQLQAFQPQAIHIATEGPLGWAARKYCLRHDLPFTTAFHTRFPEILKAALRVPLSLGYALFRYFHRPSAGVMVPTQGVMRLLDGKGFKNLRSWTHGVDMRLFKYAEQVQHHPSLADLPRPIALYVGRVSYEKTLRAFWPCLGTAARWFVVWAPWRLNSKRAFMMCVGWGCCHAMSWLRCMPAPMCSLFQVAMRRLDW